MPIDKTIGWLWAITRIAFFVNGGSAVHRYPRMGPWCHLEVVILSRSLSCSPRNNRHIWCEYHMCCQVQSPVNHRNTKQNVYFVRNPRKNLKPLWRRLLWCFSTFVVVKECLTLSHFVSFCLILSHIVSLCLTLSHNVSRCLTLSHFVSKCLIVELDNMRHFETLVYMYQ